MLRQWHFYLARAALPKVLPELVVQLSWVAESKKSDVAMSFAGISYLSRCACKSLDVRFFFL